MKYIFTLIFNLLFVLVWADGMHIKGIIKDMDTNKPLKGVWVHFSFYNGFDFSNVTDSLGQFEIITTAYVPDGYYPGELHAKGYYNVYGSFFIKKDCFIEQKIKKQFIKDTADHVLNPEPAKPVLEGYATNNLVFLIDISSSMNAPEKMPLLKESLKYLVNELRPTDRIAILTFSSNVKEILSSTPVSEKEFITKAIDELTFGSTSQGGAALDVAYKTALKDFVQRGNNRIILASDGLFTSGEKDYRKMQLTIESGLDNKIALSVFCFGKNTDYVNTKLKKLTITGNGNFARIANLEEGKLYMMEEAKAVKN